MDWLRDFQESFREPVYGFIASYWPILGTILLLALGWFVGSLMPRRSSGDTRIELDDDGGGDGGGD